MQKESINYIAPEPDAKSGLRLLEPHKVVDPQDPCEIFYCDKDAKKIKNFPIRKQVCSEMHKKSGYYAGMLYHNLSLKQQQQVLQLRYGPNIEVTPIPRISQEKIAKMLKVSQQYVSCFLRMWHDQNDIPLCLKKPRKSLDYIPEKYRKYTKVG